MSIKNLPIDQNTRAESMWRIISQRVDFRHKRVIDLGCGTGDFLWRVRIAGADQIIGIDTQNKIMDLPNIYERLHTPRGGMQGHTGVLAWDLNDYSNLHTGNIAFCFSVLPYLDNPIGFLTWMANSFSLCLIEVQYIPEPYNIGKTNDKEMGELFKECGFKNMESIGATHVKIRDAWRSIWMCSK